MVYAGYTPTVARKPTKIRELDDMIDDLRGLHKDSDKLSRDFLNDINEIIEYLTLARDALIELSQVAYITGTDPLDEPKHLKTNGVQTP